MPMETDKNKTKHCPHKERDPEDHHPPRLRTEERSFRLELTSRCRAIQNYRTFDSVSPGDFFLRLRLHLNTSRRCYPHRRFVSVLLCTLTQPMACCCDTASPPWLAPEVKRLAVNAAFSHLREVDPPACRVFRLQWREA